MAEYRIQAWCLDADGKDIPAIDKDFGDHWDLAALEFANLMGSLNYSAIMLRDFSTDLKPRVIAAFYHPNRAPLL